MIKIINCTFFIFLSIAVISCSGVNSKHNSLGYLSEGSYNYTMYDSAGIKIAEGNLTVTSFKDNKISGNYSFTKVYNEFDGYQSMSKGEFKGSVNDKEKMVLINTNPQQADNNVFFNIKIEPLSLKGDWYYSVSRRVSTSSRVELFKNQ
jgi:hypothetical protein